MATEIQPLLEHDSPGEPHSPPPTENELADTLEIQDDGISSNSLTRRPSSLLFLNLSHSVNFPPESSSPPNGCFLPRCQSAPAMAVIDFFEGQPSEPKPSPSRSSSSVLFIALLLVILYIILGMAVYCVTSNDFTRNETNLVVDSFYYSIVTLSTIGYGDITPNTTATKLFAIIYVLVGVGFIDILLSGMLNHLLDLQQCHLLKSMKKGYGRAYVIDERESAVNIRTKLVLSLLAVFFFTGLGVLFIHYVEGLSWIDSLYLTVMSVTTVGYGDQTFKSSFGRLFASVWLLSSTLGVARAFLCLAELRVDKRNREMARSILNDYMSFPQLVGANLDGSGCVSKAEFILHKLKEMGKYSEEDIRLISQKFDQLDTDKRKTISLANLSGANH